MNRNIIILGILLVVVGVCWPLLQKIPFGKLPGDIIIKREGIRFFMPITSCLVVSGIISLLFWLFRK